MKNRLIKLLIVSVCAVLVSCEGFLDPKPDQGLLTPNSLNDVQLLLDNTDVFNRQAMLVNISADDFWTTSEAYQGMNVLEQGAYLWLDDPYQGSNILDWESAYRQVFYANVALETLEDYSGGEIERADELRGMALFYKSYAYFHLLQQFTPAYQRNGGNDELLGIILRDRAEINDPSERASLTDSYEALLMDLDEAVNLLPSTIGLKTRPNQAAGYGLLARVYLVMFEYEKAGEAAEKALQQYSDRLDFNDMDLSPLRPFERFGPETIFYSILHSHAFSRGAQTYVDSLLIQSYEEGDLRKDAYFNLRGDGLFNMTGHHTGSTLVFGGLTVGELQLIAAESFARTGNETLALTYLNQLLEKRYQTEEWTPLQGLSGNELLERILLERQKELVGRGIRWTDLRRLNQEAGFEKVVVREIDGQEFRLEPGSNAYVFPIPDNEIIRSGVVQNPR